MFPDDLPPAFSCQKGIDRHVCWLSKRRLPFDQLLEFVIVRSGSPSLDSASILPWFATLMLASSPTIIELSVTRLMLSSERGNSLICYWLPNFLQLLSSSTLLAAALLAMFQQWHRVVHWRGWLACGDWIPCAFERPKLECGGICCVTDIQSVGVYWHVCPCLLKI